jgi:hypothetical protein
MGVQEADHGRIEFVVERRPIETLGVMTDIGRIFLRHCGAGRQEGKMAGVGYDVIVRLYRQTVIDILGVARMRQQFVMVTAP